MQTKTLSSNSQTYHEIGELWDDHDATDFGAQDETDFDVNIQSQRRYYSLGNVLSMKLRNIARLRGISKETLLNIWVQEKLSQTVDAAR